VLAFWRHFRLGLFVVVFVALGIYLGFTTPWRRVFGPAPDYAAVVRDGDPLVAAIYRFRAENGLWPEYLDDLVPHYVVAPPKPTWYFTVEGGASLATTVDADQTHVGYGFEAKHPGWRIFGNDGIRSLRDDTGAAATHPAAASLLERTANELAEMDQRITREPAIIEHRRSKAAVLVSLHRTTEAREVIERAARDFPDDVWPQLARAALDPTPGAVAAFAKWNAERPRFTHDYYLSLLYRMVNDDGDAVAAMERAMTLSIEIGSDDTHILAFYLFDMARFALARKQYPLVLQITNAWQKESMAHRVEENSYLPLRAAAELALGDRAAAEKDLAMLETLKTRTWAQQIDALKTAVAGDERKFAYDPGRAPPPFDVFPLPQ
jgi:hypothetical protein